MFSNIERRPVKIFHGIGLWLFLGTLAWGQDGKSGEAESSVRHGGRPNAVVGRRAETGGDAKGTDVSAAEYDVSRPATHPFPRRWSALPQPADAKWLNTDQPLSGGALWERFVLDHVETLHFVGLRAPPKESTAEKKKKRPSFPGAKRVIVKPQTVRSEKGKLKLRIELKLAAGWKINHAAPMGYLLEAIGKADVVDRDQLGKYELVKPPKAKFDLLVPTAASGADKLQLSMNYYHCQGDPTSGICKTGSVIWEIPIKVDANAAQTRVEIKYKVP